MQVVDLPWLLLNAESVGNMIQLIQVGLPVCIYS